MCCLNLPYWMILMICMYNPFEDHDISICSHIWRWSIILCLMPICIILDIVSSPFHIVNVMLRSCMNIPYSPYYYYDTIFRTSPHPHLPLSPSVSSFIAPTSQPPSPPPLSPSGDVPHVPLFDIRRDSIVDIVEHDYNRPIV